MPNKFYVTTPIYYVNARPHIGHAYSTIVADVLARRHRLLGDDTFFLTGTDEHGQKVERSAAAAGVPPQQFTDEVSATFRTLWKRMGITNDDYIRTTDPRHKQGVQKLWKLLEERGAIYLSTYTGQYCVSEEMFVDGPPGTIGPDGKPTETVTEENYFFRLDDYQAQLIDLIESNQLEIKPDSSRNEVLSFLRGNLSATTPNPVILSEVEGRAVPGASEEPPGAPSFAPFAKGGISGEARPPIAYSAAGTPFLPGALKDLSISRTSFTWGIPVPGNEKHVIYVWLDALANYITALGYGSDDETLFQRYWPADIHLVGKEITRFHCVYWPAFLLAAGLPTPKAVVANGWLLFQDSSNQATKMSKSKGNVVRAETILEAFGEHVYKKQFPESTKEEQDLSATDVLRYFLLREIPFGQDGNFSFDALITRYNADLANGYGNLVSRTLTMIQKYSASKIPDFVPDSASLLPQHAYQYFLGSISGPGKMAYANETEKTFYRLRVTAGSLEEGVSRYFQECDFTQAAENILWAVSGTDGYISGSSPWKMPIEAERNDVLYNSAESIRFITALLYPILPHATAQVWSQLGLGDIEAAARNGELTNLQWGGLKPGTKLGPLAPIFPRAPKELAQIMTDMEASHSNPGKVESVPSASSVLSSSSPNAEQQDSNHPGAGPRTATLPDLTPGTTVGGSNALITERVHTPHTDAAPSGIFAADKPDPVTPQITIDDFLKVDLRVAQILVAERIPKADKLLRLEVDLGPDLPRRQILSGIAEWYTPEELIGRRIVIVANLAPRKMRGLESHGMLLAASSGENTKPILTTFGEEIALGSRVR